MKVVIENKIPYVNGVFEPVAQAEYLPATAIVPAAVRDADALLVRTRTRCDAALLEGSRMRFIGSPTIGIDHIDLAWCQEHGITVNNAPGCNAPAVAQWVFSVIGHWMRLASLEGVHGLVLGVIGVGHVGSIVAEWGRCLGFEVLLNDPPLGVGCELGELLERSDIVTLHTPLTHGGPWPTYHLLGASEFSRMDKCRLLLNAARGGVVDERAMLCWKGDVAFDCWEGEPFPMPGTVRRALLATPHIAGYSVEGKMRGTAMVVRAFNAQFGFDLPVVDVPDAMGMCPLSINDVVDGFDVMALTRQLKSMPGLFEQMRDSYELRHEFGF